MTDRFTPLSRGRLDAQQAAHYENLVSGPVAGCQGFLLPFSGERSGVRHFAETRTDDLLRGSESLDVGGIPERDTQFGSLTEDVLGRDSGAISFSQTP